MSLLFLIGCKLYILSSANTRAVESTTPTGLSFMNKGDWPIPNQCTAGVQETSGYVS